MQLNSRNLGVSSSSAAAQNTNTTEKIDNIKDVSTDRTESTGTTNSPNVDGVTKTTDSSALPNEMNQELYCNGTEAAVIRKHYRHSAEIIENTSIVSDCL